MSESWFPVRTRPGKKRNAEWTTGRKSSGRISRRLIENNEGVRGNSGLRTALS